MKVLKPGEVVFDENDPALAAILTPDQLKEFIALADDPGRGLPPLDALAARLGVEQVPMRNKQGIMKPKRLALLVAVALRIQPPPMLVVRFDNKGVKTTFASYA